MTIYSNVILCQGVNIGKNTTIEAGSVVTRSVLAHVLTAGNPSKRFVHCPIEDFNCTYSITHLSIMIWYNEPKHWSGNAERLTLTVEPETDYWRTTHYGFIRDNGPFYYQEITGDFEATVQVAGLYTELFHQAGLMVRLDPTNWIKTGIEYVDGTQQVSAVVTRDVSDWSVMPCPDNPKSLWLKLLRKKDYVEISYSFDQQLYTLLRLAYFPPQIITAQIGLVAAAPGVQSFAVTFENFHVQVAS